MSERHPLVLGVTAEADFVLRMRLLREAHGVSQAEVAARVTRMGVPLPQQTIARIETGKRSLRLDEAAAIARALNSTVQEMTSNFPEVTDADRQYLEAAKRSFELGQARFDTQVELEQAYRAVDDLKRRVKDVEAAYAEAQAEEARLREMASAQAHADQKERALEWAKTLTTQQTQGGSE
jgi:transcriptional regulator with XRE-family HTH domain